MFRRPKASTNMEQPNYIAGILEGDPAVLQHLQEVQLPIIRSLIRDYGGSGFEAKDLFQDAVLVVYQKARQPDFQLTSQFGTFFYGICRNLWLNHRTKKSATAEVTFTEDVKYMADDTGLEEALLAVERGNLFWNAFRQLGDDCQQLLELFFQKIPMETIAARMGFGSGGYAKRRKLQCKDHLIELVKKDPAYRELL